MQARAKEYRDKLVHLSDGGLVLYRYYFPSFRPKRIPRAEIRRVLRRKNTLANGRWRIHGGSHLAWFPWDLRRPSRACVYHLDVDGQKLVVGFTVEDAAAFEVVVRALGIELIEEVST